MSWDNLAKALHDDLCAAVYCEEWFGGEEVGTTPFSEHNLNREWWTAVAEDVKTYVTNRVRKDIGVPDPSHSFPACEVCGSAVDDPEAPYPCEPQVASQQSEKP